jgi:hypothetical protein
MQKEKWIRQNNMERDDDAMSGRGPCNNNLFGEENDQRDASARSVG